MNRYVHGPFWTPERLDTLCRLVPDLSLSYSAIADRLGTTKNAAIGKARRLRLPMRYPDRAEHVSTTLQRLDALDAKIAPRGCRFPIGHPKDGDFHTCGEQARAPGEPYCEEHRSVCWTKDNRDGPKTKFSFTPLPEAAE